jgi:hypothetical protein
VFAAHHSADLIEQFGWIFVEHGQPPVKVDLKVWEAFGV